MTGRPGAVEATRRRFLPPSRSGSRVGTVDSFGSSRALQVEMEPLDAHRLVATVAAVSP